MLDWCWPKLSIPNININHSDIVIRALHKGLIKLASVNCNYSFDMFPKIVFVILEQLKKIEKK